MTKKVQNRKYNKVHYNLNCKVLPKSCQRPSPTWQKFHQTQLSQLCQQQAGPSYKKTPKADIPSTLGVCSKA